MVKHKIRRKAARAARAGGAGGEGTTRDGREEAETAADADADADAAMASLTSSHRRKVKKRAKFLESACVDASRLARASERDDDRLTNVFAQRFAWRRRRR